MLFPLASIADFELRVIHKITCDWAAPWMEGVVRFVDDEAFGVAVVGLLLLVVALSAKGRARLWRAVPVMLVTLAAVHLVREGVWRGLPRDRPGHRFAEGQILRGQLEVAACGERPQMWVERAHPPSSPSFPSSHAVTIGACAVGLSLAAWWAGAIAWGYALLVCWGRLFQGKHWPSDMVGSIVLVCLVGWGAMRLVDAMQARRRQRLAQTGSPPGTQ